MAKIIAITLAKALAWWTVLTAIVVTLCYYNLFGFSMGITIATGLISWPVTIGLYGAIIAMPVLYWTAAYLGDNL